MTKSSTQKVLAEVHMERLRQNAKWGPQFHDTYLEDTRFTDVTNYHRTAEHLKRVNDSRVAHLNSIGRPNSSNCTWDTVWLEEVYEALAEADPERRRIELIQAAAVAVAMVEHIDLERKAREEREASG